MAPKKEGARKGARSKKAGVRSQPLIAVKDVRSSSRWYSKLLAAERTSERR
jgi:hypothetical protein